MSERDDSSGHEAPSEAEREAAREAERQDLAWRDIVDHYGDRAVLDEPTARPVDQTIEPTVEQSEQVSEPYRFQLYDEEFVPPPPPPAPETTAERRAAWVVLVLCPLILVVSSLAHYRLPGVVTGLLVLGFLGGFGYLVATMSREPRDPFDDGARL